MRRRFYLLASVLYLVLGAIIVVRSITGHVVPLVILGVVFLALGLVRLRDLLSSPKGSTR